MKKIIFLILFSAAVLHLIGQTEKIIFQAPLAYPEGVAYSPAKNLFYVSSVKTGTIGTVDPSGNYKVFYKDSLLRSSFGMKTNMAGDRLWVCISDPKFSKYSTPATFKKMARLISIDLNTGRKAGDIDLGKLWPGKHFANDLTIDQEGNMYVTDSYSPVIYKIDPNGRAIVFASSEFFKSADVGLNGIAWHPQGFLLVAHNTDGVLLKVDTKDPKKISKVKMNTFFPGADGLIWSDANNLALIQNKGVNKVFRISSTDNWVSASVNAATVSEDRFQNPTTATMQNGRIWALNAKLNELSDSTRPPSKDFSLQSVRFIPAQ